MADMLEATGSAELVEWFAYFRLRDERRDVEQARLIGGL